MLPDDDDNTGKLFFGAVATSCAAAGLPVAVPACVQTVLTPPVKKYEQAVDSTIAVTEGEAEAGPTLVHFSAHLKPSLTQKPPLDPPGTP